MDTNAIYAGTASGIYKSVDGGFAWINLNNNLPDTRITSITINPSDHTLIYVGTTDGGIFKLVP